jgi:hypothetical protein
MTIPSVVVPALKVGTCSYEGCARHSLIVRSVIPMLSAANAKAFDSEALEPAIQISECQGNGAVQHWLLCFVALHTVLHCGDILFYFL